MSVPTPLEIAESWRKAVTLRPLPQPMAQIMCQSCDGAGSFDVIAARQSPVAIEPRYESHACQDCNDSDELHSIPGFLDYVECAEDECGEEVYPTQEKTRTRAYKLGTAYAIGEHAYCAACWRAQQ